MVLFEKLFPVVVAGIAVCMDLRWEKVDNAWLLFCLIVSLGVRIWGSGTFELFLGGAGFFVPFLLLGWLSVFRMLGAGDIKLLCVLGFLLGTEKILTCMLFSFFIGAIISITIMLSNGIFCQRFLYFYEYICDLIRTGERRPYYNRGMSLEKFHFTIPIFLSIILYAGGVY